MKVEKCITGYNEYGSQKLANNALWAHQEAIGKKSEVIMCDECKFWHIAEKNVCWRHAMYYATNTLTKCLFCPHVEEAVFPRSYFEKMGI